MRELHITVRSRIAQLTGQTEIVCGNSDYAAVFDLDAEWDAYPVKTMRAVWKDADTGKMLYADVLFEGSRAVLPPVYRTAQVLLGIYAGDIRTSTPVRIPCCVAGHNAHPEPAQDIYVQLLNLMKRLQTEQTYAGAAVEICCGASGISGAAMQEGAV
ncbi:MAG: hypothetical protein IK134_11990 [Oscillospiraceae bacterium]|nr:hypothetical protein [Oscillospiraceae bacterium]